MKISSVFFIPRGSAGSSEGCEVPQPLDVSDGGYTMTGTTETTIADSVKPLLTSMKLFGLYFKCGSEAPDNISNRKGHLRWNWYMIYGLVVVVFQWITVARMFSAFMNILSFLHDF